MELYFFLFLFLYYMFLTRSNNIFIGSLFIGILIWMMLFLMLPVENKEPIYSETFFFILTNYLSLICGFYLVKFKNLKATITSASNGNVIKGLVAIIFISYFLRWYDLFLVRDLSYDNLPKINRTFNDQNYFKSNILLIVASVFKSIYFFPYVIVRMIKKNHSKYIVILSYLAMFLPVIEAVLKGNRKPFFEIFVIFLVTIFLTEKIRKRHLIKFLGGFIALLMISMAILFKREKLSTDQQKTLLIEAKYNDLLPPNKKAVAYLTEEENSFKLKLLLLTSLHIGQYYTHGVFEFNNFIRKKNIDVTYGKYTFNTIPKLINKTKLFDPIKSVNPSPREFVYITTFGGFYLDFRWFSVVLMFLFGIFQKYVFEKSKVDFFWTPVMLYVLIINLFLIVINYIRGAGIYPFVSILLLLAMIQIFRKRIA